MKSFFILLLILVLAWVTVPGPENFSKYLIKKERNGGVCLNGTRHYSYKIFSIDYVDYCETPVMEGKKELTSPGLSKIKTDKYLGLFGTFWKL